jgi:hypothetical protein
MNKLVIGLAEKQFEYPNGSLVIIDEPILKRVVEVYEPAKHGLNPLPMEYREAREFAAAVFPDKDLMTYRNGRRALTRLVMGADRLDRLEYTRDDDDQAARGLWRIFSSHLYYGPRYANQFLGGSIGRHDRRAPHRKEIGVEDARIIASILVAQFEEQILIEDFGFYARPFHTALIREDRLIAGVYTLSELDDKLRRVPLDGNRGGWLHL